MTRAVPGASRGGAAGPGGAGVRRNLRRRPALAVQVRGRLPHLGRLAAVLAVGGLAGGAAPAPAVAAPGRVAFPVGLAAPASNVDAAGAGWGVARPDGGAVLVADDPGRGVVAAAIRADGTPDPAFGRGGVAHVALAGGFTIDSALRQPDGRLLLVGSTSAASNLELPQFAVARLTDAGALDTSFGRGGLAQPGIQASCANCEAAALAPDGGIVLTGNTGAESPAIATNPNAPNTFTWVVARLTPAGGLDPAFGSAGVEPVPGNTAGESEGFGAAVAADGRITLLGGRGTATVVTRLLVHGAPDPSFGGGAPAQAPAGTGGFHLAVAGDGSVTILGSDAIARLAADGTVDQAFGHQGSIPLAGAGFARLLGLPDGEALVYRPQSFEPRPAAQPAMIVDRYGAAGLERTSRVALAFGGGLASFCCAQNQILSVPPLAQNSFRVGELVPRADGSYLAVGGVSVVQYVGEGLGFSTAEFAAAALRPDLTLDPSFGPPPAPAAASLRFVAQRARTAYSRRVVVARLIASGAGLARIRVRDGRGRILAEGVEPVYRPGSANVLVQFTRAGATALRSGRRTAVTVTASFRDVLAGSATARRVAGVLR